MTRSATKAKKERGSSRKVSGSLLTVIHVDGNSVSALAGRRGESGFEIASACHMESSDAVETTRRLRHPIFMDTFFRVPASKSRVQEILGSIFSQKIYRNPTLAILSAEKIALGELEGEATEDARVDRWTRLLTQQMPRNPFDYPIGTLLRENQLADGRARSLLFQFRLADVLPFAHLLAENTPEFGGWLPATRCAAALLDHLSAEDPTQPFTICDMGKLRTLYATRLTDGRHFHHSIPVGLAGDLHSVSKSFSPTVDELSRLEKTYTSLLLPPEASSSMLLHEESSMNPQIECTRIARQVSHYALMSLESTLPSGAGQTRFPGHHYLVGRGSRLPGLRPYMEAVAGVPFRRIDRRPVEGVSIPKNTRWAEMGDNLLLLGALMHAATDDPVLITSDKRQFASPCVKGRVCSVPLLTEDQLYVFEHKTELKSE